VTVEELAEAKRNLELDISKLLTGFLKETGYKVDDLKLIRGTVTRYYGGEWDVPVIRAVVGIDIGQTIPDIVRRMFL
jgi:hypothetical protein